MSFDLKRMQRLVTREDGRWRFDWRRALGLWCVLAVTFAGGRLLGAAVTSQAAWQQVSWSSKLFWLVFPTVIVVAAVLLSVKDTMVASMMGHEVAERGGKLPTLKKTEGRRRRV